MQRIIKNEPILNHLLSIKFSALKAGKVISETVGVTESKRDAIVTCPKWSCGTALAEYPYHHPLEQKYHGEQNTRKEKNEDSCVFRVTHIFALLLTYRQKPRSMAAYLRRSSGKVMAKWISFTATIVLLDDMPRSRRNATDI